MCTSMKTTNSTCAKSCGAASHLSKRCSSMRSAMKSTQRVPARLGPNNCFRNRQSSEIEFSNKACCFSSSTTWRHGLVTSVVNVRYDFETQIVEDASHARSRAWSGHNKHCLVTNEFCCDESCSGSVHSMVQIPTCHHSLLLENHAQIHGLVHSTLCKWIELCQLDLRRLLFVRVVNKTVQQFSNVFVTVEVLSKILILNSRYRNFNHRHAPNVHLPTFASRMLCLWKHVQCRKVGCSHGQCSRHELNFSGITSVETLLINAFCHEIYPACSSASRAIQLFSQSPKLRDRILQ